MNDLQSRCLDAFPLWLAALGSDAVGVGAGLNDPQTTPEARLALAGGLQYLFKSLDLIPDGVEELGYLDDALVLRVAAQLALSGDEALAGRSTTVAKLARETTLVRELLGEEYQRLEMYTRRLVDETVRGKTAHELLAEPDGAKNLTSAVEAWAASYEPPSFARDEKNLIRLFAFLLTKLPVY